MNVWRTACLAPMVAAASLAHAQSADLSLTKDRELSEPGIRITGDVHGHRPQLGAEDGEQPHCQRQASDWIHVREQSGEPWQLQRVDRFMAARPAQQHLGDAHARRDDETVGRLCERRRGRAVGAARS